MLREYCDKCKKEISSYDKEKKVLQLSFPGRSYSGYDHDEIAKITLCKGCFDGMGIAEVVKKIGSVAREEKEPAAVEKLMDIFRELITECMEE